MNPNASPVYVTLIKVKTKAHLTQIKNTIFRNSNIEFQPMKSDVIIPDILVPVILDDKNISNAQTFVQISNFTESLPTLLKYSALLFLGIESSLTNKFIRYSALQTDVKEMIQKYDDSAIFNDAPVERVVQCLKVRKLCRFSFILY